MTDPALPTETQQEVVAANTNRLPIKTYHCRFCSHLLIASTRELLASSASATAGGAAPLKRRGGPPGLDHALILRLPGVRKKTATAAISSTATATGSGAGNNDDDNATTTQTQTQEDSERLNQEAEKGQEQAHYTIPLSTLVPETKPIIIRREDGFEKRILLKCGRCRVVVGYEIDSGNTSAPNNHDDELEDQDQDQDELDGDIAANQKRKKDRTIYLLPGSIVDTQDLADVEGEVDAVNGLVERNAVLKGMEGEWMEWIK